VVFLSKAGAKIETYFLIPNYLVKFFSFFSPFVEIKLKFNQFIFFIISMMDFFFSERATKIVKINDINQMFLHFLKK